MWYVIEAPGTYMYLGEGDLYTPVGFLEMTFMWGLKGKQAV